MKGLAKVSKKLASLGIVMFGLYQGPEMTLADESRVDWFGRCLEGQANNECRAYYNAPTFSEGVCTGENCKGPEEKRFTLKRSSMSYWRCQDSTVSEIGRLIEKQRLECDNTGWSTYCEECTPDGPVTRRVYRALGLVTTERIADGTDCDGRVITNQAAQLMNDEEVAIDMLLSEESLAAAKPLQCGGASAQSSQAVD